MHDEENDGRFPRWCQAYCRSKSALAALTFDLAEELAGSGITVNCPHPASLMNTHMVRESMIPPVSTRSRLRTVTVELLAPFLVGSDQAAR